MDSDLRRMRAALDRRFLVAVIFPVACALLGWLLGRLSTRPHWNEAIPTRLTPSTMESAPQLSRIPRLRFETGRFLVHRSHRDPFACMDGNAPERSTDPWKGFESLRLSAIWIHPQNPAAVIDNRVVRPGDGIGQFRMAHCGRDAVWLTGPIGSRCLRLQARAEVKHGNPRS